VLARTVPLMEQMECGEGGDPLAREVEQWAAGANSRLISLQGVERDEDEKVSLQFKIESYQEFTLHCPANYPDYEDDNFFVEAPSSLQLWCNALNEFLLDSSGKLCLATILSKGCSLYSSKDRGRTASEMEEGSDGSEDEELEEQQEDEQLDDMLDQDLNWELEVARRKKRWRIKEDQLRAGSGTEDESYVYHDNRNRKPKQIFTSAGASGILINDLVSIMETCGETGLVADTVGDNIFQWNCRLSGFPAGSPLQQDCQALLQEFEYDYVELQLDFSMDLYPFFPPLVKVIRPRLQGSMMLRVTTMEILKLTYWDPTKDMKTVLLDIKAFLATWARLDLTSERNDRARYPEGAYIDIEHHLLRLALVSEITPRANKKYQAVTPLHPVSLPATAVAAGTSGCGSKEAGGGGEEKEGGTQDPIEISSESDEEEGFLPDCKLNFASNLLMKKFAQAPKLWKKAQELQIENPPEDVGTKGQAKGVGYSTYKHKGWDLKHHLAAMKEKDKQIQIVLEKICSELKRLHSFTMVQGRNLPDLLAGTGPAGAGAGLPPVEVVEPVVGQEREEGRLGARRKRKHSPEAAGPVDPLSDLYAVLEGSALVPFLESKLQANNFLEIDRHQAVYRVVVGIVRELAAQHCLVSLLGPLPDQATSLHCLLQGMESQARIMIDKIGKASANGSVPKPGKSSDPPGGEDAKGVGCDGQLMARDFLALSEEVTKALKKTGFLPDINGSGSSRTESPLPSSNSAPGSPVAGPSGQSSASGVSDCSYEAALAGLQYDSVEFGPGHAFTKEFGSSGQPASTTIYRIAQEVSSLAAASSLPLNAGSSIFVRSDDSKMTLLRAVITGPEDTPYTGGVYEFDLFFPLKYPNCPPKVKFKTTGAGTVRFNPNLYNDGKVCLSLLGTWEGAQGEQWNADNSTIIQVLISIQSLILCAEPYYNEPGYERNYGTTSGKTESDNYSENVFRNSLKFAILGQLRSPPEGYAEVVRAHFYYKRQSLIQELEKKLELYKSKDIKKLVAEVKTELLKLSKPGN